jgi:hypothetical protein
MYRSDPRNFAILTGLRGDPSREEIELEIAMSKLSADDFKEVGLGTE